MIFMRAKLWFLKTPKSGQHTFNFLLLMILPMNYAERSEQNGISWPELISAGFPFFALAKLRFLMRDP